MKAVWIKSKFSGAHFQEVIGLKWVKSLIRCFVLSLTVGLRAGPGQRDESFYSPARLRTLLPPHQTASEAAITQHTRSGTWNTGQLTSCCSGLGSTAAANQSRCSEVLEDVASHGQSPQMTQWNNQIAFLISATVMVPFVNAYLFIWGAPLFSYKASLSKVSDLLIEVPTNTKEEET